MLTYLFDCFHFLRDEELVLTREDAKRDFFRYPS
jgi:hypothetical protein